MMGSLRRLFRSPDPRRALSTTYAPVLVSIAYFLGAEAAFFIGTLSDRIFAPFWPPNIVLLCALLFAPVRRWWIFIAAVFPAHVIAEIGVGMSAPQYLVAFATNCMVALLSACGIRYFIGGSPWFASMRNASLYVLIAVLLSPAVAAFGGAFVQITGGGAMANYWTYWAHWYSANALAMATLGPIVLIWAEAGAWRQLSGPREIEALALLAGLAIACLAAFGAGPKTAVPGFLPALFYLPLPFIVWGAVRFGAVGATGTILIVTLVSIWRNLQGSTVFDAETPEQSVLALQLCLTALSAPTLLLGAAIEELRQARSGLEQLAGSVLRGQDEERRRVANELHEKVGQDLSAAHLALARLEEGTPANKRVIEELDGSIRHAINEIRAVSYLLHPPLLDEGGLPLALKSYVSGLAKRSGVAIDLEFLSEHGRLPDDVEFVLFRVIQDAIVSVHQHSGSMKSRIELRLDGNATMHRLALVIADIGGSEGSPPRRIAVPGEPAGFGLAGMRERLRQIGGNVTLDVAPGRTALVATVPTRGLSRS